jgi:hypothetical protein
MPQLTQPQRDRITVELGYPHDSVPDGVVLRLGYVLPDVYFERVATILTELDELEGTLKQTREDMAIVQTCKTTFNWRGVYRAQKSERRKLRQELAQLIGIRFFESAEESACQFHTHYQ